MGQAFEQEKTDLVRRGEEMLSQIGENSDRIYLLRLYNRWYTRGIEFIAIHAAERKNEFAEIHREVQILLKNISVDYIEVKNNLTIQLGIVEGSTDHYFDVSALNGYRG